MHSSDKDFIGYRMRQVVFGRELDDSGSDPAYWEFTQDWDAEPCDDGEIWISGFAVSLRQWAGTTRGGIYFTADRNPDLATKDNIFAYRNND
jgi:hypothetical protein